MTYDIVCFLSPELLIYFVEYLDLKTMFGARRFALRNLILGQVGKQRELNPNMAKFFLEKHT